MKFKSQKNFLYSWFRVYYFVIKIQTYNYQLLLQLQPQNFQLSLWMCWSILISKLGERSKSNCVIFKFVYLGMRIIYWVNSRMKLKFFPWPILWEFKKLSLLRSIKDRKNIILWIHSVRTKRKRTFKLRICLQKRFFRDRCQN